MCKINAQGVTKMWHKRIRYNSDGNHKDTFWYNSDVIMSAIASQITSRTTVYSVYLKKTSAFVKMFLFDDAIMRVIGLNHMKRQSLCRKIKPYMKSLEITGWKVSKFICQITCTENHSCLLRRTWRLMNLKFPTIASHQIACELLTQNI